MIVLDIIPHDTIVTRDGRPLGTGTRRRSAGWVYPSVLAGSLRTMRGKALAPGDGEGALGLDGVGHAQAGLAGLAAGLPLLRGIQPVVGRRVLEGGAGGEGAAGAADDDALERFQVKVLVFHHLAYLLIEFLCSVFPEPHIPCC